MTNEQSAKWDEEMQVRVHGAAPMDDYNFKKPVYPKYSTEPARARELVNKINQSGRFKISVRPDGTDFAVEVHRPDQDEAVSRINGPDEAAAICQAIVTADIKL